MTKGRLLPVALSSKKGAALSVLSVLVLSVFGPIFVASPASAQTPNQNINRPLEVNIYVNGYGPSNCLPACFTYKLPPASQTSLTIAADYPHWAAVSANAIPLAFSSYPYPANSATMPAWLQVSFSHSNVTIARGSGTSSIMTIAISNTAQNGYTGSFLIVSRYTDPATGIGLTFTMVVKIVVDRTASTILPSRNVSTQQSPLTAGTQWALGAGLCDSGSTGQCNSNGICWSCQSGLKLSTSIPSFTMPSCCWSAIVLTGSIGTASGYALQASLCTSGFTASTCSTSGWEEAAGYLCPTSAGAACTNMCSFAIQAVSATSSQYWMALEYTTILGTTTWYGKDSSGYFWNYTSNCPGYPSPPGIDFYSQNQEPWAFESNDVTATDFSSLVYNGNPAFQYSTNAGSTWSGPLAAFVLNANNYGSWGSYVVGGGGTTPTNVVEAGPKQAPFCYSIGASQIYLGDSSQSGASCGTNVYDTELV